MKIGRVPMLVSLGAWAPVHRWPGWLVTVAMQRHPVLFIG
jgi:hypothetical protein